MRADGDADWACGGERGGGEGAAGEGGAEMANDEGDALGVVMGGHEGRGHGGMSDKSPRFFSWEGLARADRFRSLGAEEIAHWRVSDTLSGNSAADGLLASNKFGISSHHWLYGQAAATLQKTRPWPCTLDRAGVCSWTRSSHLCSMTIPPYLEVLNRVVKVSDGDLGSSPWQIGKVV